MNPEKHTRLVGTAMALVGIYGLVRVVLPPLFVSVIFLTGALFLLAMRHALAEDGRTSRRWW